MIIFFTCVYTAILFLLEKLGIIKFNLFWKLSPAIVFLLLNIAIFIPMGWGAPTGPAIVGRYSVQIVPNVSGEVIDVPVKANIPIKKGDVLFRIDPAPYEAKLRAIDAQLKFQEVRLGEMTQLQERGSGRAFDVEEREAQVARLRAELDGAKWDLESTVVHAPADGIVTNLALRVGHRVAASPSSPVMAFIDTSETVILVTIHENYSRFVAPGQQVELAFKAAPGRIMTGTVEAVLPAIASGQIPPSGLAIEPLNIEPKPLVVRVSLDDNEFANRLTVGGTGEAAIFTDHLPITHVIRRIILRQVAIVNYINPY